MSAKRSVKFKALLLWFSAIIAVWAAADYVLQPLDARLYRAAGRAFFGRAESECPQLHRPGAPVMMQEVLAEKRSLVCPSVGMVELNEKNAGECFAALPLGPQDMAVLLRYLSRAGVSTLGISAPLTWEDEAGDMSRHMFCRALGAFRHSAVGLRGRTAAQADFTPVELRDSAIPADHVQGDPSGLPSANRSLPNGLADSPDSLNLTWAPDRLEDEPLTQKAPLVSDISYPLLMRWNGETIPTLPFRLALKHLGLEPKDVGVRLGQDIRFGGRVLPLDEHGRTRLTQASTFPIDLKALVGNGGDKLALPGENVCVILAEPIGKSGESERLRVLAATLSELAGVEKSEYIKQQCPVGGRVLELSPLQQGLGTAVTAVVLLALALWLLPFLPPALRHVFVGGMLCALGIVAYGAAKQDMWLSLSAHLIAWLLFLLALHALRPEEKGIFHRRRNRR